MTYILTLLIGICSSRIRSSKLQIKLPRLEQQTTVIISKCWLYMGFPLNFRCNHQTSHTIHMKLQKKMPWSIFFFGMIIKTNIKLLTYMILPKIRVLDQSCMHQKLSMCSFPGRGSGDLWWLVRVLRHFPLGIFLLVIFQSH